MGLVSEWTPADRRRFPNFSPDEMACKCGCGMLPDPKFMRLLQELRLDIGFALPVTSGARCPKHNARVSGTGLTGPHTTGLAADIHVTHEKAWMLQQFAYAENHFTGIGSNQKGPHAQRFIHLDTIIGAGRPTVWSY